MVLKTTINLSIIKVFYFLMSDYSWKGINVIDKAGRKGVVIEDANGIYRILTIRFEDNEIYKLWLANIGRSPKDKLGIQWEYVQGKWGTISDNHE